MGNKSCAFRGNTVTMGAREALYCLLSDLEATLFGGVMSERHLGTVKWFNERKGYGFIAQENGDDVFVHYREIRGEGFKTLPEGQRVEFSLTTRDKGPAAEDVAPAD